MIWLAIGLIPEAAGIRINDVLETKVGKWLISSGLKIFLIIAVTIIVLKTIALVLDHSFRRLE